MDTAFKISSAEIDDSVGEHFNEELAVAYFLAQGSIFVNSHHWEKDWPEAARKSTALLVNCNDVFAWGTADAQEITVEEMQDFWNMYKQYPSFGSDLWCMKKRREMPQKPVEDMMRESGIDLDKFKDENNLRVNFTDGFSAALREYERAYQIPTLSYQDPLFKEIRAKFIRENGWEGDATI